MKRFYLVGLLGALLMAWVCPVGAATFVVTNTSNSGPGSLRQALIDANSNAAASPAFPHRIDATGVTGTIALGSTLPAISNHMTILGPVTGSLILDGGDARRIMWVNPGNYVTLSNLTLTNGRANDKSYTTQAAGGAGINNFGFLTLNDCTISYCRASPLNDNNEAAHGGAICNQMTATLTLNNCILHSNEAVGSGGAIYNQAENVVSISNSYLHSNVLSGGSGQRGGALFLTRGTLTVTNSTFARNEVKSVGGNGGAIWIQTDPLRESYAAFTNCTIAFNFAYNVGGGITVNGNSATEKEAFVTMDHCTVTGNHCYNNTGSRSQGGGGIRTNNPNARLTLNNSVVIGNSQGDGATSAAQLPAGILGAEGRNIYNRSSSVTFSTTGHNTVGGPATTTGVSFGGTTDGNDVSTYGSYSSFFDTRTLTDNGGATPTIAVPLSKTTAATTPATDLVVTDQRGLNRLITGGTVTRGAFDRNVISPTLAALETQPLLFVITSPAQPAVPLSQLITVATAASADLSRADVTIAAGYTTGDVLSLPANPYLGLNWSYTAGTLVLTGTASAATYQHVLRSVTFSTTSPGSGSRTLSFNARQGSTLGNTLTRPVTVNVRQAPVIAGVEEAPLTYQSGRLGEPVSKSLTLSASFATLQSAVAAISSGYQPGDELILSPNPQNGITATWDAATRQLTLAGSSSVANYQTALRSVLFQNPDQAGVAGTRQVSIQVNDGLDDSNLAARTVEVVPYQLAGCSQERVFPASFPLIDVTKPPYSAIPNDPARAAHNRMAIQAAMNDVKVGGARENNMLYFPIGTYYVDGTLSGGTSDLTDHYYFFQGQCRENTVLRLVDNAPGFDNPGAPQTLLSFFEGSFTNNAYRNFVQNMTIHTGSGNPGAVAVKFVGNNSGGLRDVTITSAGGVAAGAGAGVTGLDLTFSLSGLSLIKHVRIEGFQRAIHAARPHCTFTLQSIELAGQSSEGILIDNKPLTIRGLVSTNTVPAIRSINGGALIVVLDSQLGGGTAGESAIVNNPGNAILIRNVSTSGYGQLLTGSATLATLPASGEYASAVFSNNLDEDRKSLNLPIVEVPDVAWEYDFTKWAIIDGSLNDTGNNAADFDQVVDDGPVIQAAVDAGKTFIAFTKYIDIRTRVTLRNQLRWLMGNWVNVNFRQPVRNGEPSYEPGTNIGFQAENTGGVLKVDGLRGPFTNSQWTIVVNNNRSEDLILAEIDYPRAILYRNTGTGRAFFEMIFTIKNTPTAVADGRAVGEEASILIKNQDAYFWALDLEIQDEHCDGPDCQALFINDGGRAVILGAKFGEREGPWFYLRNKSRTEIMGAVLNVTKEDYQVPVDRRVLVNEQSDVSASLIERRGRETTSTTRAFHTKFILETDACGGSREFNAQSATTDNMLPLRGGTGTEALGTVVPLYVGRYAEPKSRELDFAPLTDRTTADIGQSLTLSASRPGATGPVTFELVNTPASVATLEANILTIRGAGSVTVRAAQGCDANYTAVEAGERQFEIQKLPQTITFTQLADVVYQSNPLLSFGLTATATSGLPVSYTVAGPATLSGTLLTLHGIGPVTLKASQTGDELFLPAEEVIQTFVVTTTDKEKGVKPLAECVSDNGNGTWTARFGYKNDMDMLVYIPVGPTNYLTPAGGSEQVVSFEPHRVQNAFTITFAAGSSVSWSVAGPDGKLRTATATTQSAACAAGARQGVEEVLPRLELMVFPNPAHNELTVKLPGSDARKATLYLMTGQGQTLYAKESRGGRTEGVNLRGMAAGVYFILVRMDELILSEKLVVE